MKTPSESERFTQNLRHPLVRKAANHQANARVRVSEIMGEIRALVTEAGEMESQIEVMTLLIGDSTDPGILLRDAAMANLQRLFEGEPDSRAPLQQSYQEPVWDNPQSLILKGEVLTDTCAHVIHFFSTEDRDKAFSFIQEARGSK